MNKWSALILLTILLFSSCREENLEHIPYNPNPYEVLGQDVLGSMPENPDNPITEDGVILGQHLFFDNILSADNTMSCSTCHHPEKSFTDGFAVSNGIQGLPGSKSAMALINLGYNTNGFFWDGRSPTLEDQALHPVLDPLELNNNWEKVEEDLQQSELYSELFRKAFGINNKDEINRSLTTKALAQYQRAITSYDSKFDRVQANVDVFEDDELLGYELFYEINLLEVKDAQCGHCHSDKLFTTNQYFNNGIQEFIDGVGPEDKGRFKVTGNKLDMGKFRAPTLRNIMLTAPYMHDGRFETIDEVIEHYNSGGHNAPNLDANIIPLELTEEEKEGLKAFLATLTDTSYLKNPYLQNPFK